MRVEFSVAWARARALVGFDMTDDRKKLWREHHETCAAMHKAWERRGFGFPGPKTPPFPDILRGLACGAKTRAGSPCKRTDLFRNGRCKFHGGLSTGPRSAAGKARARDNLKHQGGGGQSPLATNRDKSGAAKCGT